MSVVTLNGDGPIETSMLRLGDRVAVTVGEVTAGGSFVCGVQAADGGRCKYAVNLDGTGQMVFVEGSMLSEEQS